MKKVLILGVNGFIGHHLSKGSYFGGRRPEDGRIDWRSGARDIHNLVRGVAPPYPGAFTALPGGTLKVFRTQLAELPANAALPRPSLSVHDGACIAVCKDGSALRLLEMEFEGKPFTAQDFLSRFGDNPVSLET